MFDEKIDIKENYILEIDKELLSILLKDRSSHRNIIWATENYAFKGYNYDSQMPITINLITGRNGRTIKPRVHKSKKEQLHRVHDKAEVFTPSWICNAQNNLVDHAWFGHENVFNIEGDKSWTSVKTPIEFPDGKTWQEYVTANRLEITCGEAPYLCSRYDTVSGEWIELSDRIGLLDRKLRVIGENTTTEEQWLVWTMKAFQAIYGFEWQGDSLLIARENLLFTFIDYYQDRFQKEPTIETLKEIANIISWNIWQMDGLKGVIPDSCKPVVKRQISFFDDENQTEPCQGCQKGGYQNHTGIYCKVMDWETKKSIRFVDLLKEKNNV